MASTFFYTNMYCSQASFISFDHSTMHFASATIFSGIQCCSPARWRRNKSNIFSMSLKVVHSTHLWNFSPEHRMEHSCTRI